MIIKKFDLDNVFMLSEIIDKMELDADIDKITKTIQTSKLENKADAAKIGKEVAVGIGIDLCTKLIRRLHKAKDEVKELICDLTGLSKDEVKKFGIKEITQFFTDLFNQPEFGDFFNQAGDLSEKK
jgi:uncharacterized protein YpuA (DUF1002 family)